MFQRILIPYDGSERAKQAVPVAARLARASGGTVLLLQVTSIFVEGSWPGEPAFLMTQEYWQAKKNDLTAALKDLAACEVLNGVQTEIKVVEGGTAEMILATAQSWHADLITMCSHGRTGLMRWMLGSIVQKIARHSSVPVLILRTEGKTLPPQGMHPVRILVGLDGSALAETVLAPAAELSVALSAPAPGQLHLVRALPLANDHTRNSAFSVDTRQRVEEAQMYLHEVEQRLMEQAQIFPAVQVTSSLVSSLDIAETLMGLAEMGETENVLDRAASCEIIALATHGRSGLAHWMMGSITERILGSTTLPLLIVHPQSPSEPQASEAHEKQREHKMETVGKSLV